MGEGKNRSGNSRRWIVAECEQSLRRLGTDRIDLYQIHRPDPSCSIDETLGALSDLVHEGKILYFGTSTFPAHELVEAQWVAERRSRERFVTEQPPYSILARGVEADVLPVCVEYGIGVIPWSPLAGGWLSGSFGAGKENSSRRSSRLPDRYDLSLPENQRKLDLVTALESLSTDAGLSIVELAIGFVLAHRAVSAPIIGPRTMEHLESLLAASEKPLSPDVLDRIDDLVPPGSTVNAADAGWVPAALTDSSLRRRTA